MYLNLKENQLHLHYLQSAKLEEKNNFNNFLNGAKFFSRESLQNTQTVLLIIQIDFQIVNSQNLI